MVDDHHVHNYNHFQELVQVNVTGEWSAATKGTILKWQTYSPRTCDGRKTLELNFGRGTTDVLPVVGRGISRYTHRP